MSAHKESPFLRRALRGNIDKSRAKACIEEWIDVLDEALMEKPDDGQPYDLLTSFYKLSLIKRKLVIEFSVPTDEQLRMPGKHENRFSAELEAARETIGETGDELLHEALRYVPDVRAWKKKAKELCKKDAPALYAEQLLEQVWDMTLLAHMKEQDALCAGLRQQLPEIQDWLLANRCCVLRAKTWIVSIASVLRPSICPGNALFIFLLRLLTARPYRKAVRRVARKK